MSETSIYHLVHKYAKTQKITDIKRCSRPAILKKEHYTFIDRIMVENDELTAYELLCQLKEAYPSLNLSLSTVHRARRDLGWIATIPRVLPTY